jgi:hypothetical protein
MAEMRTAPCLCDGTSDDGGDKNDAGIDEEAMQ